MKKFPMFVILLCICGCNAIEDDKKDIVTKSEEKIYLDNNPLNVGLYQLENNNFILKKEIKSEWQISKNIVVLITIYSNKDKFNNDYFNVFNNEKAKYANSDKYKIGYNLKFYVKDKLYNQTILRPNDALSIFNYIQVYLYDDFLHKDDEWYSHTTDNEFNDETLLTTIKLTGSDYIDQITSEIILTVFTYNDMSDFDNNNYRGNSSHSVTIKKNNL